MKSKARSKLFPHRLRRRAGDSQELAAQLAPLEELAKSSEGRQAKESRVVAQENGAIVVGTVQPGLAKVQEVMDAEERKGVLGLEPVVFVIVGLFLAFIAFIAWQVSRMTLPE